MQYDALADMFQQTLTGILNKVEHVFEAVVSAVIGIWHDWRLMAPAEFGQSPQLLSVRVRAALLRQREIVPVHRQ